MKRVGMVAIALAIACGWSGVANATSHGLMPANLSFWEAVIWQLDHFWRHIDYVYSAVRFLIERPSITWQLLVSQTACASTSPVTAFLFGSPYMALTTFFVTVATPIVLFFFALHRAAKMLARRAWKLLPQPGFAPRLELA